MAHDVDYVLYLATDPDLVAGRDLCAVVDAAIAGGVTVVQYRDKHATARELYDRGRRLLDLTRARGVPLIINDRVDLLLALDADGVHLGPKDLPPGVARRIAPGKMVGCSVNCREDLELALAAGADYVGIGPAYATATKADLRGVLGPDGIRALTAVCPIPSVGIGGIGPRNCGDIVRAGVTGVCVISAILTDEDPGRAARTLRAAIQAAR